LVPWWTWIALVFFAVVVLVGVGVTIVALVAFRRLGSTSEEVARSIEELATRAEALEWRIEHAGERAALVERKIAKLNASIERLSVLTWAIGDVARKVAHVRSAVLLRK
jgi:hypothetical protein